MSEFKRSGEEDARKIQEEVYEAREEQRAAERIAAAQRKEAEKQAKIAAQEEKSRQKAEREAQSRERARLKAERREEERRHREEKRGSQGGSKSYGGWLAAVVSLSVAVLALGHGLLRLSRYGRRAAAASRMECRAARLVVLRGVVSAFCHADLRVDGLQPFGFGPHADAPFRGL